MPRFTNSVKCYHARGKNSPLVIVIPIKIREQLNIESGMMFEVSFSKKGKLIYKKVENVT